MSTKLEIARMLVLSTAHVTHETAERLPDGIEGLIAYEKGEYGWLLSVQPVQTSPLPNDLQDVVRLARSNQCDWIMLDRDGDVTDQLPAYEWGEAQIMERAP